MISRIFFHIRGGKYTEEDARAVMTQILYVVAFCHLQGVVHRDLKPEVRYTEHCVCCKRRISIFHFYSANEEK